MPSVALPTAGIVHEYRDCEALFSFYEDGLKGLIRDMVLVSDSRPPMHKPTAEEIKQEFLDSGLPERIMTQYAQSPDARFLAHTGNTTHEAFIEMAAEVIYQSVVEMMNSLFLRLVYEVRKQRWSWIGNDLVVSMRILERPQR